MTDYTSNGAVPVEDAVVEHPPTVDEVMEEQRRRDDLPDPSDDPRHQQVIDPDEGTIEEAHADPPPVGAETVANDAQRLRQADTERVPPPSDRDED